MSISTETLLNEIAQNPNLPSPPGVALRVLEKAGQPDCTVDDLNKIITLDSALSGKILKTVNSVVFGLSRTVTSIQRALVIIGLNSARSLTLSLSLPEMHRNAPKDDFMRDYWKQSVIVGIVTRELAKKLNRREPEDDSMAGLLCDLGQVVLRQVFTEAYPVVLKRPARERALNLTQLERQHCGVDHPEVSAFLLKQWRFPEDFSEAVRVHHEPAAGKFPNTFLAERAFMLQFASLLAQLQVAPDNALAYEKAAELAKSRYDMDARQLIKFLSPLKEKVDEFARILDVDIGKCQNFTDVMAQASRELVNLTMAASADIHKAREEKQQIESEAQRWREEAAFDPLTRAFNRRFFERQLAQLLTQVFPAGSGVGIVYIDLDGFKPLNDKYGHAFGDQVLVEVAGLLQRQLRQGDVVVRMGGDEFCVLVERATEADLQGLAQRVLAAIQGLVIRQGSQQGIVGASIGVALGNPCESPVTPQELVARADLAMYQAKRSGKNRIVLLAESPGEMLCGAGA